MYETPDDSAARALHEGKVDALDLMKAALRPEAAIRYTLPLGNLPLAIAKPVEDEVAKRREAQLTPYGQELRKMRLEDPGAFAKHLNRKIAERLAKAAPDRDPPPRPARRTKVAA